MTINEPSEFQKQKRILVCSLCAYFGKPWPEGVNGMLKSAKKFNIEVRLFGTETPYRNAYFTKLVYLGECLEACFNEYDWVLAIDAEDSRFLRPLEDIFAIASPQGGHLFSAERNCWPEPRLASSYPAAGSSFRYLNGGGFFGRMPDVWRNMELLSGRNTLNEDQHVWAKALCMDLHLDWKCEVFQTLFMTTEKDFDVESGRRLRNRETGTLPCILHGNGGSYKFPIFKMFDQ